MEIKLKINTVITLNLSKVNHNLLMSYLERPDKSFNIETIIHAIYSIYSNENSDFKIYYDKLFAMFHSHFTIEECDIMELFRKI